MRPNTRRFRAAAVLVAAAAAVGIAVPAQSASAAIPVYNYQLTRLGSGGTKLCLTSTGKGAAVVLQKCANTSAQRWFQLSYGNAVVLTNVASVSKTSRSYVLTASSQSSGATFTMQPVSGGTTQQWKYGRSVQNNGFVNNASGRVLAASSVASGARVKVATADGGYLQGWSDYGSGSYS